MSQRLLLALDEHWPQQPVCPWVLLGPDDQPVSRGESDPRHWPQAERCEVLLRGPQALWLEVPLPRGAQRRDLPRLLSYALEDRLLKDPDSQALLLTHRGPAPDGEQDLGGVLVVAKERLRQLVAQLQAVGHPPHRMYAELQTCPASDQGWHLSLGPGGGVLRTHPEAGQALDLELLPDLLPALLARAGAQEAAPARLTLHLAPSQPRPELPLELPIQLGQAYEWWQGLTHGRPTNLLQGEFAPRESGGGWLGRLLAPALLGAGALGLWLVATLGQTLWLGHEVSDAQARIARVYQTSFPNSPMVAPAAQMRQQLNLERSRRGLLKDDDALALLAQAAEALGTDAMDALAGLQYEEGRLDLILNPASEPRARAALGLLASRGLLADLRQDGPALHLLLRRESLQ
jgi:type II secretion system protein L